MPAFEAVPGMPYWQDLITTAPQKAAYFYSKVLGWEISRDEYRLARKDGLPVAGIVAAEEQLQEWIPYFFSSDADRVEKLGGQVLSSQDVSLGRMTVCADPHGALFGLMQPAGEDTFVAAGEPGVPVWYEYVGPDTTAVDFYGELFDWEVRNEGNYYVAFKDGAPFLGMEIGEEAELPFWQIYFGVEDMASSVQRAQQFGANYLTEPVESPFGLAVYLEDAVGAGCHLCEVAAPQFEEISEADSILNLNVD